MPDCASRITLANQRGASRGLGAEIAAVFADADLLITGRDVAGWKRRGD